MLSPAAKQQATCNIHSDKDCADSLGCANLAIAGSGDVVQIYTNYAVTVNPASALPRFGPGCLCVGCSRAEDPQKLWDREVMRNGTRKGVFGKAGKEADPVLAQATALYYDSEAPLPDKVWIPDVESKDAPYAYIYSGPMLAFDRQSRRQVATGWMTLVQLRLKLVRGGKPTNNGWIEVDSSSLPPGTLIIRHPWRWSFEFHKEVARY